MKINHNNYTSEFKEVLSYCEKKELCLGEGNPNSKILIIGKEIGGKTPQSVDQIKTFSNNEVRRNLDEWRSPDGYNLGKIKEDVFRDSKNPTWTNYQKMVSGIIGNDLGRDNYNFLDHCFMTELSQVLLPNSNFGKNLTSEESKEIDTMRKKSVRERAKLFAMPFFRNFPIVIMACGHYPRKLNFNIEETFHVKWTKETKVFSTGNFYNVHYGKNKNGRDKILIHTRQLSLGVTNQLLFEIANLCKNFFENK